MLEQIQSSDLSQTLYDAFQNLSLIASSSFSIWYRKRYRIPLWKNIIALILLYTLVFRWSYLLFWIESGFAGSGTISIVRALRYTIIFAYPVAKILKIDYKTLIDYIAPLFSLSTDICLYYARKNKNCRRMFIFC